MPINLIRVLIKITIETLFFMFILLTGNFIPHMTFINLIKTFIFIFFSLIIVDIILNKALKINTDWTF